MNAFQVYVCSYGAEFAVNLVCGLFTKRSTTTVLLVCVFVYMWVGLRETSSYSLIGCSTLHTDVPTEKDKESEK